MINYNANLPDIKRLINKIYKTTLKYFNQSDIFELEVNFVNAKNIKKINRDYRGVDSVTDVLSFPSIEINKILPIKKSQFPYDVNPESGKLMLGETFMCIDKIKAQAIEFGHGETREAAYLFLHSLLHLFGYDHIYDCDKQEMRKIEDTILNALNIAR